MKRIGKLFEKIYDIDNLLLAHKNASKGKKTKYDRTKFKQEIRVVNGDLMNHMYKLQKMLIDKTFVNSEYEVFIKNDTGKERTIYKLPYFPDRILHHAIMQILGPIWKKTFIADTYQSIKGRGIHKAKKKIEPLVRKTRRDLYVLKIDIKKFYPNVDNEILKKIIRRKIKCKGTLWLLDNIIDSINGLPIGNYLSQALGNLYLTYMDHKLKETCKLTAYFRYCDDIVIFSRTKVHLHKLRIYMSKYLKEELKLDMKSNYQVFPIRSRGLDFLGYRFFHNYTLVRKSIVTRFKKAVIEKKYDKYFNNIIASYNGWFISSNCFNLRIKYNINKKGLIC